MDEPHNHAEAAKTSKLGIRFRAKGEHVKRVCGLLSESQGQKMALTVLYVPNSLDSGLCLRKSGLAIHVFKLHFLFIRTAAAKFFRLLLKLDVRRRFAYSFFNLNTVVYLVICDSG